MSVLASFNIFRLHRLICPEVATHMTLLWMVSVSCILVASTGIYLNKT